MCPQLALIRYIVQFYHKLPNNYENSITFMTITMFHSCTLSITSVLLIHNMILGTSQKADQKYFWNYKKELNYKKSMFIFHQPLYII